MGVTNVKTSIDEQGEKVDQKIADLQSQVNVSELVFDEKLEKIKKRTAEDMADKMQKIYEKLEQTVTTAMQKLSEETSERMTNIVGYENDRDSVFTDPIYSGKNICCLSDAECRCWFVENQYFCTKIYRASDCHRLSLTT